MLTISEFSPGSLIGDTNLFLSNDDGSEDEDCPSVGITKLIAEAEIMIAEPAFRGKGMGKESMLLMLKYGHTLNVDRFTAKIGIDNVQSQRMFEKFGFTESSRSEIFQEITFDCVVTKDWLTWLDSQLEIYEIEKYR